MGYNTDTYTKTFSIDLERANYHLKCKKRRRKRILIVAIVWAIVFVYFFTPISKVNLKVSGNVYYKKNDLMKMAYIDKNEYWWLLDTKSAKKVLDSYDYIYGVEFKRSFLGVTLKINEVYPVGVKNDKYVMSDKRIIEKDKYDSNDKVGEITNLNSINEEDLDYLVSKYSAVKLSVREHFGELEIVKDSNSYSYVKLHGYDDRMGYFIIKVDLVYLNTKFNGNKYDKIIEEISKNNVKYEKEEPALVAYHYLNEEQFQLVEIFEEE